MKYFTLILWYIVGAVINLLCYKMEASYTAHYIIGIIFGSIGGIISNYDR